MPHLTTTADSPTLFLLLARADRWNRGKTREKSRSSQNFTSTHAQSKSTSTLRIGDQLTLDCHPSHRYTDQSLLLDTSREDRTQLFQCLPHLEST